MTSYTIEIGYCAENPYIEKTWPRLKEIVRRICDNPPAIVAEARRLGAPETCSGHCCELETFAANYAESFGEPGHPIRIYEARGEDNKPGITQGASAADHFKFCVRRAFIRLVLEAAHRENIELNLRVS